MLKFGKICETLGPWEFNIRRNEQGWEFAGLLEKVCTPYNPSLPEKIHQLSQKKWFYPHLNKMKTLELLKEKENGTFLLRFSNSRNCWAIAKVNQTQNGPKISQIFIKFIAGRGFG
jgi:hypothetical protein